MPNKYLVIMHLYVLQWYILLSCKNNLLDVVKSIQNNVGIEEQIDLLHKNIMRSKSSVNGKARISW